MVRQAHHERVSRDFAIVLSIPGRHAGGLHIVMYNIGQMRQ